ncbi:ubiquitin thioesterase OTUB1-like [Mizuhopecten yessoensis]|uniref:ubiquitinyl hydrolase 1 n=1 Tax=Mizuhopecten yessoensis TaxID=6573 RepID=A0A210QXB3_MIZYE|nr:ubiquitin thioesterase OTUB1-like [Mizuhopecten yessoensis]OWF53351.1 Ubiquitin thioesterase OTUB1 [Mizuhopecten yessoensis]
MAEAFNFDPDKNYDEATMEQQRNIEKEISANQALVSFQIDFDTVSADYSKEDETYLGKIQDLKIKYKCVRRTRGDGNCFYRAFGFAYLEQLLTNQVDYARFKEVATRSKDELVSLGFPQFTIEDFHDTFMDVVEKVGTPCTTKELHETFNDQGISDYLVVYLRLLVSGYLQKKADFYQNFIEGGRSVKEFCNQEVEPMGKESDHLQVMALTSALGVAVRVVYMDRGESGQCNHHDFPEESSPSVYLLYRPGHYDILYS